MLLHHVDEKIIDMSYHDWLLDDSSVSQHGFALGVRSTILSAF
jgi:hypothetical protein